MRSRRLEVARILTGGLLRRIVAQLAVERARMRQVEDDQPVGHLRMHDREDPGDAAAPVVPDDDGVLLSRRTNHRGDVVGERRQVGTTPAGRSLRL